MVAWGRGWKQNTEMEKGGQEKKGFSSEILHCSTRVWSALGLGLEDCANNGVKAPGTDGLLDLN